MARFEHSRERKNKRDSRDSSSKRDRSGRRSFEDFHKGKRDSGRVSNNYSRNRRDGYSRNRRDVKMTKVICSLCGKECDSNKISNKDFDIINEKLDKIMKALKIE